MRLDGLIAATNDILKLGRNPSASELRGVCMAGCRELTIMSDDDAFLALIDKYSASLSDNNTDVQRVLDDLAAFGAFVQEELRTLTASGLDAQAAEALLGQAENVRQTTSRIRINPKTIQVGLYQLRDEVCDLVNLFGDPVDTDRRRKTRTVLRRVAWVVGGATIVLVNATATSLTAVYVSASVGIGTGLIGHGIRGG
jgi:hypothetical protein